MKNAILFLFMLIGMYGHSQTTADTSHQKDKALNVFLDCMYCDMDYLRTELSLINYVRDRKESDVDIVSSSIQTGSGGNELTFVFIGRGKFNGQKDTLKTNITSFETEDGMRKKISQTLKLGLARYIAKTPFADKLNVSFAKDTARAQDVNVSPELDKWKSWVFTANVYGTINKQALTNQLQFTPSLSISKVTPDWKLNINGGTYYQDYSYIIDGANFRAIMRTESFGGTYVKSLGEHFSTGFLANVNTSTQGNIDLQVKGGPAIEFSIFPYSECTHKQLRFLYALYGVSNNYVDTTIFGKINDRLAGESFTVYSQYKQQWGSLSAQVTGQHYFYDPSKYEVNMSLNLNLNLFEGFSVSINSYANVIHDQIFLPASGASSTDILLGLQTLATTYQFGTGISFTYTFGSIYNNIVNPRFNLLLPEE